MENSENKNDELLDNFKKAIDFTKLPEYVEQIENLIPMIKAVFPLIVDQEAEYNLQPKQKVVYMMTITKTDLYVMGVVIQLNPDNSTTIVKDLWKHQFSELVKKLPNILKGKGTLMLG